MTAPTLIMVGERDLGNPVSAAQAIHERIQGSKLVVVPGALHLTNIEKADFFTRQLLTFLARDDLNRLEGV